MKSQTDSIISDALHYATASQKRAIRKLRKVGYEIIGSTTGSEKITLCRTHPENSMRVVLADGSIVNWPVAR